MSFSMPKSLKKIVKPQEPYKRVMLLLEPAIAKQLDGLCSKTKHSKSVVVECLIINADLDFLKACIAEGTLVRRKMGRSKKSFHDT